MTILNEDAPFTTWIVCEDEFKEFVPEEAIDFCPDCAEKIVKEAKEKTGATGKQIFIDGNSSISISNESDCEMVCEECGESLYTELIE